MNQDVTKAIRDIKALGLHFNYAFDPNCMNKCMISIQRNGYSMNHIISQLKDGEALVFMLSENGSIYWPHDTYGNCIRVDSTCGSIRKWLDTLGEEKQKKLDDDKEINIVAMIIKIVAEIKV